MKQHPVPQHIASYQFHLIGEMTLKQFLELIAGLITGFIIYSLHFPSLLKLPLILLVVFTGLALAFLPIQDRPLDQWFVSFFKAIYSPTHFIWKKNPHTPSFLTNNKFVLKKPKKNTLQKKTTKEIKLKKYLATFSFNNQNNEVDKKEDSHLLKISQLLKSPSNISFTNVNSPQKKTNLKPIVEPAPPLTPPILVESSIPHKLKPMVAAQFSTTLPIPSIPNTPNIIVGMVLTPLDKIVPGAIIEIINQNGETARALKSNKLGQFFCASQLKNGQYQIKIEHPQFKFDTINIKVEGKIIPPIKIKAKQTIQTS